MRHMSSCRGQGLVEYVMVVVLMALLAVGAVKMLGRKTHNAFVEAGETLQSQMDQARSDGRSEGKI